MAEVGTGATEASDSKTEASEQVEVTSPAALELKAPTIKALTAKMVDRQGISETTFYRWRTGLKELGIDAEPVQLPGTEGFKLTAEILQLYDALNVWMSNGGAIADFVADLKAKAGKLTTTAPTAEGEFLEEEPGVVVRKAAELKAASMIAAYRQAAILTLADLPDDLREQVEVERGKLLGSDQSLDDLVADMMNGIL